MSSAEEANKSLEAFQQLTGCDQQTARALLEAANWNLEVIPGILILWKKTKLIRSYNKLASTLFFDHSPDASTSPTQPEPLATSQPIQNSARTTTKPQPYELMMLGLFSDGLTCCRKRTGGIRTFSDFGRDESDEDEDDDSHNTYYAGGEKRLVFDR